MTVRRIRAGLLAVFAAAALSACGGSSNNGVASKQPDEIVAATKSAVQGAKSVRVRGAVVSNGQPVTLNLDLLSGKGGRGQVSTGGLSFRLLALSNSVYINGSAAFWRHFGGNAAAQLFQGKWLRGPATGNFRSFASLTNLPKLLDQTLADLGTLSKGRTTTVDGQPVVAVNGSRGGTLYVATTGPPYPVEIRESGSEPGRILFDRYNESVSLSPPANTIDISQFQNS